MGTIILLALDDITVLCRRNVDHLLRAGLAGLDVLVERLADSTCACKEFLDVTLDLLAEASLIEVEAEDIPVTISMDSINLQT